MNVFIFGSSNGRRASIFPYSNQMFDFYWLFWVSLRCYIVVSLNFFYFPFSLLQIKDFNQNGNNNGMWRGLHALKNKHSN